MRKSRLLGKQLSYFDNLQTYETSRSCLHNIPLKSVHNLDKINNDLEENIIDKSYDEPRSDNGSVYERAINFSGMLEKEIDWNNECKEKKEKEKDDNNYDNINYEYNNDNNDNANNVQKNDDNLFTPENLAIWALDHNVPCNTLKNLLHIVKTHSCHKDWPSDPRTLLNTMRKVKIENMPPGHYFHFGLEAGLLKYIENTSNNITHLTLSFGIDGLPLSKSSNSQFWPILCRIISVDSKPIFLVGLYHGYSKPNCNMFLSQLTKELKKLCIFGIFINNKCIRINIAHFICDAPARCFILNLKGHTGFYSCTKCVTQGQYLERRVCFPEITAKLRTHFDFINQEQEEHHIGETILKNIPNIDFIKHFPLDYMHLICLGVVKKLVKDVWIQGKPPAKLSIILINNISSELIKFRDYWPCDFERKPRSLSDIHHWKATEYRQLILYLGPVIFRKSFEGEELSNYYIHFLTLHVAVQILICPYMIHNLSYAKELLISFVKNFITLYGKHLISYNVHNLLHIANDSEIHGILDDFSAFSYESFMQPIKKLIRKSDRPLQQVVRRISEKGVFLLKKSSNDSSSSILTKFNLKVSQKDCTCLLDDGTIVQLSSSEIFIINGEDTIKGKSFLFKTALFCKPCKSTLLNIYKVKRTSDNKYWPVSKIIAKMICLPIEEEYFAVFPLTHKLY